MTVERVLAVEGDPSLCGVNAGLPVGPRFTNRLGSALTLSKSYRLSTARSAVSTSAIRAVGS